MAASFIVLQIGRLEDDGPAGECGVRVAAVDGNLRSELLMYCVQQHKHSKQCAQDLLDVASISDGVTPEEKTVNGKAVTTYAPNPMVSPRTVLTRHLDAKRALSEKLALDAARHEVESFETNDLV